MSKARLAKDRRPVFSAEVLRLFAELEAEQPRPYDDKTKRLAILLGLTAEWLMAQHVNKRGGTPQPWRAAFEAWHTVHAVREQLLAAVGPLKGGRA